MSNTTSLEASFKIGVLKELHRRQFLTRDELERAIKAIETQHSSQYAKG